MKRLVLAIPVLALALGGTTACATKKFVKGQVGEVNGKVEGLSRSVEETQERTRANEGRIGEVDQKAQAAGKSAQAAGQRADGAQWRLQRDRRPHRQRRRDRLQLQAWSRARRKRKTVSLRAAPSAAPQDQ